MNDDQQWLKHLSNKLNEYEEPAPEGLWDDIARSVAGGSAVPEPNTKQRARVMPLWLRRTCAAAAVAAIVAALWLVIVDIAPISHNQQPTETYSNNTDNNIPALNTADNRREATEEMENTVATTRIPVRNLAVATGTAVAASAQPIGGTINPSESSIVAVNQIESSAKPIASTEAIEENKVDSLNNSTTIRREMPAESYRSYPQPAIAAKKRTQASRLSLNLYAANLTGDSRIGHESGPTLRSQYLSGEGISQKSDIRSVVQMSNTNKEVERKMSHKFPVRAGLSLRYDLNSRLALSTGVQYSYLTSDFSWGSAESFYSGTQRLHYIGIPVSLICNIWSNDRLSLYATGGMTMEKCIDGRVTTDYTLNGEYTANESSDATEKRLQWSATAAVGVQYRLVSRLSLYAEPGVCYYIDNHSSTDNIYKERPFNFNFNLGLRFTLH